MAKKCDWCGRFLDRTGACTIECGFGWCTTPDGFKVHPDDAVFVGTVQRSSDGVVCPVYEMKWKAERKHRVQLW